MEEGRGIEVRPDAASGHVVESSGGRLPRRTGVRGLRDKSMPLDSAAEEMVRCARGEIDRLFESMGERQAFTRLRRNDHLVADATTKILLYNERRVCRAIMVVSSEIEPKSVADAIRRADAARLALGESLGRVVVRPSCWGEMGERSYAIFSYHRPMTSRRWVRVLQKRIVGRKMVPWLDAAVAATSRPAESADRIVGHLSALMDVRGVSDDVRCSARKAIGEIESGRIAPHYTFMHGDMWRGNILLDTREFFVRRFGWIGGSPVLIDWGASRVDGYGIYDLLCLVRSLQIRRDVARASLARQSGLLGGGEGCAEAQLLGALGAFATSPGHVSVERMAGICNDMLSVYRRLTD